MYCNILPPSRPSFDQNQAPTSLITPPSPHRLRDLQYSLDKLMLFPPQLSDFVVLETGFIVSAHRLPNITDSCTVVARRVAELCP